ncbi:MAG: organomercurial lyase [Kofleriaceae bacterium]
MSHADAETLGRLHHLIIKSLVERGHPPVVDELSRELATDAAPWLDRLVAEHGVVLHPGTHEIWIAHPFSASPTAVWIDRGDRGWWAPCLWCALGIATLAAPRATIHTRFAGESEPAVLALADGTITPSVLVHFAYPARDAWRNVVHWCASVLPFRDRDQVVAWSTRHAIPHGDVVPIDRVMALARVWYGGHLDPAWRKWTGEEAKQIFAGVGLTGAHWALPSSGERF